MSVTRRDISHSLKGKLFSRSRKLSPQSTASSNSHTTPPAPARGASTSPSTLSTFQLSLQSPAPASNGESSPVSQHGIAISIPLQNGSSGTAAPPSPSLWQRVHSIARDRLSKKERELLDLPTGGNDSIESAISAAKGAHKAAKDRRWVYRSKQGNDIVVMERVGRILRGMENYAKIGDILIQSNPEITALVWGAARFILQVGLPPSPRA
jgi:hypothetical protein